MSYKTIVEQWRSSDAPRRNATTIAARTFSIAFAALTLALAGCAGINQKTYHAPTRKSSVALDEDLRWKVMARIGIIGYNHRLPKGTYTAFLEDGKGVYYRNPTERFFDGNNFDREERGGLYIPSDGSLARLYMWPAFGASPLGVLPDILLYADVGSGRVPVPHVFLPNDWKTKVRFISQ